MNETQMSMPHRPTPVRRRIGPPRPRRLILLTGACLLVALSSRPAGAQQTETAHAARPAVSVFHYGAPAPAVSFRPAPLSERPAAPGDAARSLPPLTSAGLSVLEAGGVAGAASDQGVLNVGAVDVRRRPQITGDFSLRNTGTKPLTLSRLEPSCHCTSAALETAGGRAAALPLALAPGQEARVRMTVDAAILSETDLLKTVSVFIRGHSQPVARLVIAGTLEHRNSAAPGALPGSEAPLSRAPSAAAPGRISLQARPKRAAFTIPPPQSK